MKSDSDKWLRAVRAMPVNNPQEYRLRQTFAAMLAYIHCEGWEGACHPASAVLTVLLKEQEVGVTPFLGECSVDGVVFDHSWIEVDSKVYDAAISNTLIKEIYFPPVFGGMAVGTGQPTAIGYGIQSGAGYDAAAAFIGQIPFGQYMDDAPHHPDGLWGTAKLVAKSFNLRVNPQKLRTAHQHIEWRERE